MNQIEYWKSNWKQRTQNSEADVHKIWSFKFHVIVYMQDNIFTLSALNGSMKLVWRL